MLGKSLLGNKSKSVFDKSNDAIKVLTNVTNQLDNINPELETEISKTEQEIKLKEEYKQNLETQSKTNAKIAGEFRKILGIN